MTDLWWTTQACQIEVIWMTLENSIRDWLRAEKVKYEQGAGIRSGRGAGSATYFAMTEDDAARCRKFFATRLREQRARFNLEDYQ